jgi:hypothetical protein
MAHILWKASVIFLSSRLLTSSSSHLKFCRFCTHSKKLTCRFWNHNVSGGGEGGGVFRHRVGVTVGWRQRCTRCVGYRVMLNEQMQQVCCRQPCSVFGQPTKVMNPRRPQPCEVVVQGLPQLEHSMGQINLQTNTHNRTRVCPTPTVTPPPFV